MNKKKQLEITYIEIHKKYLGIWIHRENHQ